MEKEKITTEEFLDIYENRMPMIEDYVRLINAKDYDFSNDKNKHGNGASKTYRNLSKENGLDEKEKNERIVEKFFAYMARSKKANFNKELKGNKEYNDFFKKAFMVVNEKNESYGDIIDPDSESLLLQEIYKDLWDEKVIKKAKDKNGKINGDTLNSVNTTLNQFYKYMEALDEFKDEKFIRKNMQIIKDERKCQSVSITYILSRYFTKDSEDSKIIGKIIKDKNILEFLNIYHTLGNFMPIPAGSNRYRASGIAQDYLDITLMFIYNYYMNGKEKDNGIKRLIDPMQDDYEEWLNVFGKGQEGWDEFVRKNYFGDENFKINFVPKKGNHYGAPRELWENHFIQVINSLLGNGNVLPKSKEQCIEYFTNAKNWISTRGELMVEELANRVNDKKDI